jgi:hypothetical protein
MEKCKIVQEGTICSWFVEILKYFVYGDFSSQNIDLLRKKLKMKCLGLHFSDPKKLFCIAFQLLIKPTPPTWLLEVRK